MFNFIAKIFATAVAIFLIVFPEPATTATGVLMLAFLWAPGLLKKL
jgi:hypothetical protein